MPPYNALALAEEPVTGRLEGCMAMGLGSSIQVVCALWSNRG